MDRRLFLAAAGAGALAHALPAFGLAQEAPAAQGSEDARLRALLDRFFYAQVDESPEWATSLGLDNGERAPLKRRLDGRSLADKAGDLERAKARRAALLAIDRTRLGEAARIDRDVVAYQLDTAVGAAERFAFGGRHAGFEPYVLTQRAGAYQDIPDFLDNQHSVKGAEDADAYLDRLRGFAVALDQDTECSRADAARDIFAPGYALDTTLGQMEAIRQVAPGQTVLVRSLARKAGAAGLAGDYEARARAIVETEVFPALDRQIGHVREIRARAVEEAGVWRLAQGEAYYAAALAARTTSSLGPEEVHRIGLDQVAEISGRIDSILKGQGHASGTVAERLTALNKDPAQLYPNTEAGRAALLAELNAQIQVLQGKLPQAFKTLPRGPVDVKRVPPEIQDGASNGYYQRAALDGSRNAAYFINLKDTADWPKYSLATLTYHEASPGHHLQISLQQQSDNIPLIRRTGGFSAFSEGWALYAEQLADELGMYERDPLGRAGYLQSFLFRAARLVVDTGMHHKRWSRARATDYMIEATGYTRARVQREIDRYSVWPGQACSYKVGHTVWARLREKARAALGARFDVREFHDAGLLMGAMPLTVLEGVIDDYVAARKA